MGRELVCGLDLGTTSVKAVIFDLQGNVITESEQMITSYYPHPGWVEQDPKEIERSSVLAIKEAMQKGNLDPHELLTVGISAAMHSIICVDHDGELLSNMIIWSDGRSSEQAKSLIQKEGRDIYARTGTPIHPMTPLLKLLWMKDTNNEAYYNAAYFISMKEFLLQKWFGRLVVDYSIASATGLFNLQTKEWDDQALGIAGIKKEQLSEIVPPTEVLTGIDPAVAEEMGISTEIPFVIGAGDGQLANLGNGSISTGEVNVSVGTSGAIRQFIKSVKVNKKHETFTYAFTKDTSIIGGPTNNGGIALHWLKDLLDFKGSYDELTSLGTNIDPGANGVIFHPYVNGERAPLWNVRARGNFFGLGMGHRKEHLVRAVLEGITFNIYQIGKSLEEVVGAPEKITINGGLTKSLLWVQIMADVFGKEIHLTDTHHNAAWGAAWTALVGIGRVDSFEAIKENLPAEKVVNSNRENHELYKGIYKKYEEISKGLKDHFTEL